MIAAGGIVALETMVERLADDHARARRLADGARRPVPGRVDPATVRTNIVCAPRRPAARRVPRRARARGVRCGHDRPATVRLVTHKDVDDDEGIDRDAICRA